MRLNLIRLTEIEMKPKFFIITANDSSCGRVGMQIGPFQVSEDRQRMNAKVLIIGGLEMDIEFNKLTPLDQHFPFTFPNGIADKQGDIDRMKGEIIFLSARQKGLFGYETQQENADDDWTRISKLCRYIAEEEYFINVFNEVAWLQEASKFLSKKEGLAEMQAFKLGLGHADPGTQFDMFPAITNS